MTLARAATPSPTNRGRTVATRWRLALIFTIALAGCSLGASPTASPTAGSAPAAKQTPTPSLQGLATPTGSERKVDSALLDLLQTLRTQGRPAAEQQARDIGLLSTNNEVRLTLLLANGDTKPVADKVRAMGGRVANSAGNMIDILIPLDTIFTYAGNAGSNFLQDLAAFTTVKEVRVTPRPNTEDLTMPPGTTRAQFQAQLAAIVSEGVAVSGADRWQAAGITGKGVKIGIIDQGFAGYEALLGNGLPSRVTAKAFNASGTLYDNATEIHGTAVAEIVHGMAPDAELYLTTIDTAADLMLAVRWLVDEQGVKVISMSLGWHQTRGDGSGPYAEAVDYARSKGVLFVKSAGNEASAHYMGVYADGDANGWDDFAPGQETLRVQANTSTLSLDLTWDAWSGQPVNYDLYVLREDGTLVTSSRNDQGAGKEPVEHIHYPAKPGQIFLIRIAEVGNAGRPVRLDLFAKNSTILDFDSPAGSISTPGDAKGAFTVGATQWKNDQLEPYSSQGPTLDQRLKPELAGPTRVSTVSYSKQGTTFSGTSASAPHVAGAAALVFSGIPNATADSVVQFLESRARDLQAPGPDNQTGYGRLQLGPPPTTPAPAASPATNPSGTPGSAPAPNPPTPAGTARAGNGPAFTDQFTSATSGLPTGAESRYDAGKYLLAPNAPNRAVWATYGATYTDLTVEVTVQLDGAAGAAGILFWQTASDDYFVFNVTGDGYFQVARFEQGRWSSYLPWTKSEAIVVGGPNRLTVETRGATITVSANGKPLGTTQTPTPGSGRVGLIAATFSQPGLVARFSELRVTPAR